MADAIDASFGSLPLAASGLRQAIARFDTTALDEAIVSTNIVAEMSGDLMVREGERGGPRLIALADDGGASAGMHFVSLPWEEAVEEFRKRGNVTPYDLQRLIQGVATRSAEERAKLLQYVQERTYSLLAEAIGDDASTYKSFAEGLRDETIPLGINADDDGYLQMVFRTNVQGAYSAGRDRASKDPELLAERPIALYLTAGDGLVRSEHAAYAEQNGGMYRIGSPEWEAVRPPPRNSPYNCRCSWVTLTLEQAQERGWQG